MSATHVYKKAERFLVAMRSDGKFFALDETFATTSPGYVDHPADAKHITAWKSDKIHDAPYYFENSSRMRAWLKNCKMVWVTVESIATLDEP